MRCVTKKILRTLILNILNGEEHPLHEWLVASKLICLRKPPPSVDGIRPIGCGETFVRVAARLLLTLPEAKRIWEEDPSIFGGIGRGGAEPMLFSMADAVEWAEHGMGGIDFENAFNTVCRHQIAKEILDHAKVFSGFFSVLYNRPSKLVTTDANGETLVVWSETGGRQGDPMMPLFFSMVMKTISKELDQFSLEVTPEEPLLSKKTPDEVAPDPTPRTLKWSLLDDLNLAPKVPGGLWLAVDYMERAEFKATYGLTVNRDKCWYFLQHHMRTEGAAVLGSWIGGPNHERSRGSELTVDAAKVLEKRIASLGPSLTLQHRMILLRVCYVPTLNYLLRTLPPRVGVAGVERFDNIVFQTIMSWVNDRSLSETDEVRQCRCDHQGDRQPAPQVRRSRVRKPVRAQAHLRGGELYPEPRSPSGPWHEPQREAPQPRERGNPTVR